MSEEIEHQPEEIIEEQPKTGFLEKLKVHKFKILGGILGIFVFAGAVFGAYKFGQRQIQLGPKPTSSPSASSIPTDWEIYTADEVLRRLGLDFSIKYPNDWYFTDENPYHASGVPDVVFSKEPFENVYQRSAPCLSVIGDIGVSDLALEEFIKQQDSGEGLLPSGERISLAPEVKSAEEIVFDSYKGIKRLIVKHGEQKESFQVFIKDGPNYTYSEDGINFFIFESCPNTEEQIFNLILSTFKFLE